MSVANPKEEVKAAVLSPVVLPETELDQELSLAERSEKSLIERLKGMEDAARIFQRRNELIETCYLSAIKRTRPQDWVLFSDKQCTAVGMLTASGADLVAEVYGIVIQNLRPLDDKGLFVPERIEYANGAYALRGRCDAWSRVNGRSVEGLEAARRSDEDFTGRAVDKDGNLSFKETVGALDTDLRSAVLTLLRTKAVRVLCGMTRVPVADLSRAWKETGKGLEQCRKGHGYGTSTDRQASSVADADVQAEAKKLGEEIMRRVSGDKTAAVALLKEITSSKDFKGFESVARFTLGWQVESAWKKLRIHATFGDASQREAGAEG